MKEFLCEILMDLLSKQEADQEVLYILMKQEKYAMLRNYCLETNFKMFSCPISDNSRLFGLDIVVEDLIKKPYSFICIDNKEF